MRNLAFMLAMTGMLPMAAARPFAGVLLWSWISFMNPHRLLWGAAASEMPWAYMIFGATVIGCFIAREPKRLVITPIMALIIAFLICITYASFFALAAPEVVFEKYSFVAKTFFFLLITALLLTDHRRIHAMIWIMVIALGYFGIRGGAFALMNGGNYRVLGPPETMINDNNHLAAGLLVMLPLMNYLRLQSKHRIVRIVLLAAMMLTLFSVLASYSRGALIGLAAMSAFLWLRSQRQLVFGAAMVAALAGAVAFMPQKWHDRMNSIGEYQQDESAEGRIKIWQASLAMALARPLTGGGFKAPYTQSIVDKYAPGTTARAVHSIYFEVIGENGFLTFFVWLAMPIVSFVSAQRVIVLTRKEPRLSWANDLARMAQVSIVAYLVAGAFLSLCYWDYFFTLLIVVGALRRQVAGELSDSRTSAPTLPGTRARLALSRSA